MNKQLEAVHNKFLQRLEQVSDVFGLNGLIAKMYGVLYLKVVPLSLDEISDALGVSKGNVSMNIRVLEKWGAVKKIWVKGSRKDFYEADPNIKKIIFFNFKSVIEKRLGEISEVMEEFNKVISATSGELSQEDRDTATAYEERLKKIGELKKLTLKALVMAENFI